MRIAMNHELPERNFSNARRASKVPVLARIHKDNENKERITIRLDADVLAWFRQQVNGGGNYQTLINAALRGHMEDAQSTLERTVRRVVREELRRATLA